MNRNAIRALNKFRLLKSLNLIGTISLHGSTFKIPVIKRTGYGNLFAWEPWMHKVMTDVLAKTDGVFIDVGANLGQSLLHLKAIDKSIPYIGFEPNPDCVFYLRELVRLNNFENVTIIPAGVSDKTGVATLDYYADDDTDSMASIITGFRPDQTVFRREYVPCVTFEETGLKVRPGVIKIDVEGAELSVVKGMLELIEQHRPHVIIEILPIYKPENIERLQRQERLLKIFRELGYRFYRIDKGAGSLMPLEDIGIHGDERVCDYMMSPD